MAALERFLDIIFGMVLCLNVLRLFQFAFEEMYRHTFSHRTKRAVNNAPTAAHAER